jgi:hypothetical protein
LEFGGNCEFAGLIFGRWWRSFFIRLIRVMPIASIGSVVRVTPRDDLQILRGKDDYEIVDDRTPFRVRVLGIIREDDVLIGVSGPAIDGHPRYDGLIAPLLVRCDGSRWESDVLSGVNFKVGSMVARRVSSFPVGHPDGTVIDSYPYIMRYGIIESET